MCSEHMVKTVLTVLGIRLLTSSAIFSRSCRSFCCEPVDLSNVRKTMGDSWSLTSLSPGTPDNPAFSREY